LTVIEFQLRNSADVLVATGTDSGVNSGSVADWTPGSNLVQEATYRFRVRAKNAHLWSSWSGYFTFTVDTSPPATPSVSSPLYLNIDTGSWNGGVGQAGSFTLGPAGSGDVIEYNWRWLGGGWNPVGVATGASHVLGLSPPGDMEQVLQVRSVDHAGNMSSIRSYAFLVRPQPVDVAWWKFDEGAGTIAGASTGGTAYDGVLHGDVAWVGSEVNPFDPQAAGAAVSLDGAGGHVQMPRVLATNHAAGWSVTAWVYASDLSGDRTVVAQDGAVHNMFRVHFRASANGGQGGWCFTVRESDSLQAGEVSVCSPADQVIPQQWMHLAAVYDQPAGQLRLWVDAGPNNGEWPPGWVGEVNAPAGWAGTGGFQVGRARTGTTGGFGEYWHGRVDEVRAHQRVLTEFEIQETFLMCRFATCPQVGPPAAPVLVGRWELDEGAGSLAADSSGMGNGASLQSGAVWTASGHGGSAAVLLNGSTGHARTPGPVLVGDQSYTVAAWVRIDWVGDWHTVLAQEGQSMSPFRLMYRHSQDGWCFTIRLTDTVGGTLRHACGPKPVVGVWTHLVGVYDAPAGVARLYVNGQLAASVTGVTSWHAGGSFLIGRTLDTGGAADHFPGTIDGVRAFQSALSATQAQELYNGIDP
jgi:hypothetical protein